MKPVWQELQLLLEVQVPVVVCFVFVALWVITGLMFLLWHRNRISNQRRNYDLELAQVNIQFETCSAELRMSQAELVQTKEELTLVREHERHAALSLAEISSRYDEQKRTMTQEVERLTGLKNNVIQEFERLVSQLMQNQQKQFVEVSQQKVESVVSPLQQLLNDFRRRIDQVHSDDVAQTNRLLGQIQQLQSQSQKIGEDAVNLTNALKGSNKVLGDWGEWVLQRLLEDSGLLEGRDYDVQVSHSDAAGKRLQPDVLLNLPQGRHLIVDSKVSLLAYERLIHSDNAESRQAAEKDLVASLKQHLKGLARRRYDQLPGVNSPDFVVMFVPIEPAYTVALQVHPGLLREAKACHVLLAGPSTLMAVLNMVETLWQRERQDRNVEQIVQEAGKMHDQFVRFIESMNDVGSTLDRAKRAHELALSRLRDGKGNLIRRAQQLQELGAKNQKVLVVEEEKVSGG